jgi:hypothetical protein
VGGRAHDDAGSGGCIRVGRIAILRIHQEEVYTLHTALMAGLLLALHRWAEDPAPRRLALVDLLGGCY